VKPLLKSKAKLPPKSEVKPPPMRTFDGNRQRCVGCGHPRVEHRRLGCSVPKCVCVQYGSQVVALDANTPKTEANLPE
jgi:hypothetical protein